jgi:thymidylate synthase
MTLKILTLRMIPMTNNLDKSYLDIVKDILETGTKCNDRTGVGTLSKFGVTLRHKMSERISNFNY